MNLMSIYNMLIWSALRWCLTPWLPHYLPLSSLSSAMGSTRFSQSTRLGDATGLLRRCSLGLSRSLPMLTASRATLAMLNGLQVCTQQNSRNHIMLGTKPRLGICPLTTILYPCPQTDFLMSH